MSVDCDMNLEVQAALTQRNYRDMPQYGVTVHGVFPPPVTGMTLCTRSIADAISNRVTVRCFNWSNGAPTFTRWFLAVKTARALATPFKLLFSRRPRHGVFYMPVNAGLALYFNYLAFAAARLRGYRCAAHHHIYKYLDQSDYRIKLLDRLLGANGLHVVLCPDMERRLHRLYGCRAPMGIVPSTVQLLQSHMDHDPTRNNNVLPSGDPFRIGLISNLQMAKGVDLAVDLLRALLRENRNVRLVLAGPIYSQLEQRLIDDAKQEFGDALDYRGPVYGDAKRQFFRDIHVKVFPTRYPDAQPLVITEAFSYARPVVAYGRGCIPGMMGEVPGWSVPTTDDFVAAAVVQIGRWMDEPQSYAAACRVASERYRALITEARRALDEFVNWICCEPDHGFVHRRAPSKMP